MKTMRASSVGHGSRRKPSRRFLSAVLVISMLSGGCEHEFLDRSHIPPAIADLEEGAEDVFELALAGRWARAAKRTTLLRETTARFEADERRQFPDLERAIADLDRAIVRHDVRLSAASANDVFRQTVLVASQYLDEDITSILLLDVEAREILIHADDDQDATKAAVQRVGKLWLTLRPEVEKRRGHDIAVRCDGHLTRLSGNCDAQARKDEAKALLETIDAIEDIF